MSLSNLFSTFKTKRNIKIILFVLISYVVTTMCFDIVGPGERGVYVFLGKLEEQSLPEGFHWKTPLVADIVNLNVRQVVFNQQAEASSKDLQTVYTGIAVNYSPDPSMAWKLFQEIGITNKVWEKVLLRPAIQEVTKAITARFTAEELITKRENAKQQITKEIIGRLAKDHINVTEVSITDFKFNKAFNVAIESKQIAEQRAQQAENELLQVKIDAKQIIVKANARKEAQIHIAGGKAKEIELLTMAEANFHKTLAKVVTPLSLKLRAIESWDGALPKVAAGNGQFELNLPPSIVDPSSPQKEPLKEK